MIHEQSKLIACDNSGAKLLEVIRVLGGTKRRYAYTGDIVVTTVKVAVPRSLVKKGDVVRAVIVRTRKEQERKDGSSIRFDDNAAVVLEKETSNMVGTRVFGPVAREVRKSGFKKIVSLASEVW